VCGSRNFLLFSVSFSFTLPLLPWHFRLFNYFWNMHNTMETT
jgi:hypothetical protein